MANRHPFLYTEIIKGFIHLSSFLKGDLRLAIAMLTASQMLLLELEFLFLLTWMLRHHIHAAIRKAICLWFVFFPLIPLYAISNWKDTPFSMAFLLYFTYFSDIVMGCRNKTPIPKKQVIVFLVGMFLVAFTRNNGIYIIAFTVLCICIIYFRQYFKF